MLEKLPDFKKELEAQSRIRTEEEYIAMCVQYAISGGWVAESQKGILIDKYLKPIYKKYLEIIEELRREGVPDNELAKIILKMNNCLESTRRIGSTDPNNIIRSIEDSKSRAQDFYTKYALESLLGIVVEVLQD